MSALAAPWTDRAPQLEPVVTSNFDTWLPSLMLHLRLLETSGQNILGVGDLRIAHATADRVRRLLTTIPIQYLPEPSLAPFSGGGLALAWTVRDRELSFTAYPDQDDFVFIHTNENDLPIADGVLTLEDTEQLSNIFTAFLTR